MYNENNEIMEIEYPIIIHGSENSLDKDAYVIVNEPLNHREAKLLCDSYKNINANLLYVEDGVVKWCYKGTVDECNNSILTTYNLHVQNYENPIKRKLERQYGLKSVRCIRGLLSYNSRTHLRSEIKKSLVSTDMDEKIATLKLINLNEIKDFDKNSITEAYKFFAFQLGQTLSLIEDNVELFTKNTVAQYYPELKPYLNREKSSPAELQKFLTRFINFVENKYEKVDKLNYVITNFHNKMEFVEPKEEKSLPKVVIFDIDQTLMDESHRAQYRDVKNWEKYFELCHLDTPIESMIQLTKEYKEKGFEIWLMSGRTVKVKDKTIESLKKAGAVFDNVKLRGEDNKIPDFVIKPSWAQKLIGVKRIEVVFDDKDNVIEGYRKKGINVIDVKPLIAQNNKKFKHR
jgi:hypothetical protein